MLIIPDEVVTGALVNAIAVVGRQISKAVTGGRESDDVATARWFETFRLTGTLPEQPDLPPEIKDRLTGILNSDEVQAALQELLAVRLTDAPETDAFRARDAVSVALSAAGPGAGGFAEAVVGYYDDQICSLVARLEGKDPPLLAQIRSEAFSARMISALHTIARNTAAIADSAQLRNLGQVQARPRAGNAPAPGWLLADVTDPFALEVHRPVRADDSPPGLPVLPEYVLRDHDRTLAGVVQAAEGSGEIAVLVGGSSTGKTRACWEALGLLRDLPEPWRLWHPIDPSRPKATLRELPLIAPRTVVWLNEAQFYLAAPGGLGERVAAGLWELLRDPSKGPVLVLATLWPQFWDLLTARPPAGQDDPHAQARELLSGRDISVPAAFTATQVKMLAEATDPRLAMAAAARDGQVIQFLAGGPELLARYRHAPPAAAALMSAAIDGRRLGMEVALPLGFLAAAAPGYMTEDQWDQLDEEWLGHALDYTAADCKGTRGPLTRIRPRLFKERDPVLGPACRLADYLDQHGRQSRRSIIPPPQFWTAAATYAAPGDLGALARAAEDRGLLRDAARLRKRAVARGDTRAAAALITSLHALHLDDAKPVKWAATYASLNDTGAVAWLLWALQNSDAADQAEVLLARDPAGHARLDDPYAVTRLLRQLRRAGGIEQAEALATRAAAHANLDDARAVARLLRHLRRAEQAKALAARAAAYANLDDSRAVASLLRALREIGSTDEVEVLLARVPAAHANLDDSRAVARLLRELRRAGDIEQAGALAARVAAHADLADGSAVGSLLRELREAGVADQAQALLVREPTAYANLEDPHAVASLLEAMRREGAADQVDVLLARDPAAQINLGDPLAVARLLRALLRASAGDQVDVLLARDPAAHANLDDPHGVASLLETLRRAGTPDLAKALATRAAARANLDDPGAVASLLEALRWEGAADQAKALATRAAARANLDDPGAVARLLRALLRAGAADQVDVLLARDPAAHADLDAARAVARLLRALRGVGATDQVESLTQRLPDEGLFALFCEEANSDGAYLFGRERYGGAAPAWGWDNLENAVTVVGPVPEEIELAALSSAPISDWERMGGHGNRVLRNPARTDFSNRFAYPNTVQTSQN